jgi:hypothetical protein
MSRQHIATPISSQYKVDANVCTNVCTNVYTNILSGLDEYTLTTKLLSQMNIYMESDVKGEDRQPKSSAHESLVLSNTNANTHKERFFYPKECDQLFWIYYIFVKGFSKYEMTDTSKFINEKAAKLECIELLRMNKTQLDPFKIKGLKDTVEDDLVNSKKIDIKTFIALCIVSNLNVLFLYRRSYYEIACDPDNTDSIFVVHQFDSPSAKYAYEDNIENEVVQKYRENNHLSHSITTPLKGISSYKVGDLRDIRDKLKLVSDDTTHKTKAQLYKLLVDML